MLTALIASAGGPPAQTISNVGGLTIPFTCGTPTLTITPGALPQSSDLVSRWTAVAGPVYDGGTGKVSSHVDYVIGASSTVSQGVGAQQPVRVAAAKNGRPVIRYAGASSQFLAQTSSPLATLFQGDDVPWTVAMVFSAASLGAIRYLFSFGRNASASGYFGVDLTAANINAILRNDDANLSGGMNTAGAISAATWYILVCTYTGTQIGARRNAASILAHSNSTNIATITPDRFTLGAFGRSTIGNYFDGDLADLAIYDVAMTTGEMDAVAAALNTEWAVY